MDQFYTFGLAALVALCFKVLILFQVRATSRLSKAFVVACFALVAQNALEFCGYITFAANPATASPFLHSLIITLYMVCGSMVYLCAAIAENRWTRQVGFFAVIATASLSLLHVSGLAVVGFHRSGYSIISEPGPAYFAFQIFAPLCAVLCIGFLVSGLLNVESSIVKRCRLAIVAILPLCLIGIVVTILREMGFNSSTAIVMPLASTFMVWLLMHEARGDIVAFKLKWRFIWSIFRYAKDTTIDEWPELTDRIQLIEAMKMCDNNKSKVAVLLKTSPSTITRKCARYGLDDSKSALSVLPARIDSSQ